MLGDVLLGYISDPCSGGYSFENTMNIFFVTKGNLPRSIENKSSLLAHTFEVYRLRLGGGLNTRGFSVCSGTGLDGTCNV